MKTNTSFSAGLLAASLMLLASTSVGAQGIEFSFANVTATPTQVTFDIMVEGDAAPSTLGSTLVYLQYNAEAFGSNISGGVTAVKGALFAPAITAFYTDPVVNDNSAQVLAFGIDFLLSLCGPTFNADLPGPGSGEALMTVTLPRIADVPFLIEFVNPPLPTQPSMNGQQFICDNADVLDPVLVVNPLPIELTSFEAIADGNDVVLTWETATEIDNAGFQLERSADGQRFDEIGFIEGAGDSFESRSYAFRDVAVPPNTQKLFYRIASVDFDGVLDYSPTIEVSAPVPDKFHLNTAYPNPFNGRTVISYDLPEQTIVKLVVFDALGRQVKSLVGTEQQAGRYSIPFNANNLPSGVYIYRLEAGSNVDSGRVLLVK